MGDNVNRPAKGTILHEYNHHIIINTCYIAVENYKTNYNGRVNLEQVGFEQKTTIGHLLSSSN